MNTTIKPHAKPAWLKRRLTVNADYVSIRRMLADKKLHTVCQEARCPNQNECWAEHKTATFMILGRICTRSCRFCAVASGRPAELDPQEPENVAYTAQTMGLKHVVITSVTRDDLADGGASVFAETIVRVRRACPYSTIEILPSDMGGVYANIKILADARPDVLNHNIEVVKRLSDQVRSKATYARSLNFLRTGKEINPELTTKSGLMVGLGESAEEVLEAMCDLREAEVNLLTIGQYLQPTPRHHPVDRYWHPDEFAALKQAALQMGFAHCESGPLVRSSYHASRQLEANV